MKDITVSKIEPTNPVLLSYIDRIKAWDKEGNIKLERNKHIDPFYALYYDATFFGAGMLLLDRENSVAMVEMINASMDDYNEIQNVAETKFQELIAKEYGTDKVNFSYVKKRG